MLYCLKVPSTKGYCGCPVGVSGVCCHVLAILLFLKHFTETKETILALTCTEQLQKWYRRTKKGSIPMMPLRKIKVTSAKSNKNIHNTKIIPADPAKSNFHRDVLQMKTEVNEQIKKKDTAIRFYQNLLMVATLL